MVNKWLVGLAAALCVSAARAEVCALDDLDREVCLSAPASRIAALSPGATELVYAAGAGDRVVAVVSYSDYPPEARDVVSVGSHTRLDLEALVALEPDLAIGWVTGNPAEQLETLEALDMAVFYIEPRSVDGVAGAIERLATLAGTEAEGRRVAERFLSDMAALGAQYAGEASVDTFYQVWDSPLMSVNDEHLIGQVIRLCGGRNVFGELGRLVPRLDDEAVLAADPAVIVAGGMGEENRDWLDHWTRYPELRAVQNDHLYFVPPSLLQRPTPRLAEGARLLCGHLATAREDAP
ncbi:cobalamin-binding protein [Halomonas sp. PAMB 3232]|uniref:cobalamin-binding protein n=1 Tax=Halomonas sp. PAMB 3232 TaxID=3075221 RepID=UPI00390839B6